ncbi:MAG: flagellar hook-basal body complex protein [Lachnospiraceae bacterium]
MDPNAKYDQASNSFTINMALEEILKDFSGNAMVVAAGDNVKVTNPAAGATANITQGQEITVTGEVTLTKAQLESAPYNLIYDTDKGAYFMKGADGKSVEITDDTAWGNALKSMKGLESVENVKVTKGDPPENITISFDAKFESTMDAVYDGNNNFGVTLENTEANQAAILEQVYHVKDGDGKFYTIDFVGPDGSAQINMTENNKGNMIVFDSKGKFSYIGGQGQNSAMLTFNSSASSMDGKNIDLSQFTNIDIDFSSINNFGNGGMSTLEMLNGSKESSTIGAGRKQGELNGIEVGQDGRITAYYDNGLTKLLGQIAVAEFANPSGLSKAGNNLYSATQNSGEFNGVGTDITANGGQMTSGVLEMSNVDLSGEFTTMITTQRGFQANSRIITVSDTLLEELVNLKR